MRFAAVNLLLFVSVLIIFDQSDAAKDNMKVKTNNGEKQSKEELESRPPPPSKEDRSINEINNKKPKELKDELKRKIRKNGKEISVIDENEITAVQELMREYLACTVRDYPKDGPIDDVPFTSGDIILTVSDVTQMLESDCQGASGKNKVRARRQVIAESSTNRWPIDSPIYITLSDDAQAQSSSFHTTLDRVIADFNEKTCLPMVKEEPVSESEHRILIITEVQRCSSRIGRSLSTKRNTQSVYVGSGCKSYTIMVHELFHAMGVRHEHSRADRDEHVTVNFTNIKSGAEANFDKCESCPNVVEYNTQSAMHYSLTAYGLTSGVPVLTLKDPKLTEVAGVNWHQIAFLDWKRLNEVYCKGVCATPINCGDGYQNSHNCTQCICPDGLGDGSCDNAAPEVNVINPACGGPLIATEEWQTLEMHFQTYEPEPNVCEWVIMAEGNSGKVELVSAKQNFLKPYVRKVHQCYHENLEVRTSKFHLPAEAFCGYVDEGRTWTSDGSRLMAIYRYKYGAKEGSHTFKYRRVAE